AAPAPVMGPERLGNPPDEGATRWHATSAWWGRPKNRLPRGAEASPRPPSPSPPRRCAPCAPRSTTSTAPRTTLPRDPANAPSYRPTCVSRGDCRALPSLGRVAARPRKVVQRRADMANVHFPNAFERWYALTAAEGQRLETDKKNGAVVFSREAL